MIGVIDNYDFKEMEPMRYWSPPASWDYEKKKTTTQQRIFSGDWWAAEKKDGYFAKFVKDEDGNMMLLSRSRNVKGEFPNKIEWVPHLHKFLKIFLTVLAYLENFIFQISLVLIILQVSSVV